MDHPEGFCAWLLSAALPVFAVMAGCVVDPPDAPKPKAYVLSAMERKLAACPDVSSSDPAASTCLEGTYEGMTLANEACSLTLGQNGSYQFSSPALMVSRPATGATFSFNHTAVEGFNLLSWRVSDAVSLDFPYYSLDFSATFGSQVEDAESEIEIELTERGDTTRTSMCIVKLRG